MNDAEHAYTPPSTGAKQLPEALLSQLDGAELPFKTQALCISTIDLVGNGSFKHYVSRLLDLLRGGIGHGWILGSTIGPARRVVGHS